MKKSYIKFLNKNYPVYEINLADVYDDQEGDCFTLVAQQDLWEALDVYMLFDDNDDEIKEPIVEAIDNKIFFYCNDDFFNSNPTYEELIEYLKESVKNN